MLIPLLKVLLGVTGIILLIVTYAYIDKLEKTGCECAMHKYKNFIKKYALFAVAYLALSIVVPEKAFAGMFGEAGAYALFLLHFLFVVATMVFFVLALIYAKYLMEEKCKCSEDMRREILYYWSILMIAILGSVVVIPIFMSMTSSAMAVAVNTVDRVSKSSTDVRSAMMNPLKSAKRVPGALRSQLKMRK